MVGIMSFVQKQRWRRVDVENDHVEIAIVINVSERGPPSGFQGSVVQPRSRRDFLERAISLVAE